MFEDRMPEGALSPRLPHMAALAEHYAMTENAVAHGGHVRTIAAGHYTVAGLSRHVRLGEFVAHRSATGVHLGEVVRVEPELTYVCPIEPGEPIGIHDTVIRKGAFRIAPSESWCGRTINSLGEPIDGLGPLTAGTQPRSISNTAPPSMTRKRVETGFKTGVRAIDIFSPLCLGQRLGIFAGSGVGKSTLLSMLARADAFDKVVIALVGERGREVREFIEDTLGTHMQKSVAVVATSDESPMLRKMAPLSAITIAEHFRDQGDNVLLIVDSVTRFAHAIREVATASGEPPIARGYPASVFTELPRLLERAGPGPEGTGTITAIISILVDGDNHNDPIADSTRGILDGHIVLQRSLAEEGRYPPIDPLASVSRLARKAWTPDQEKLVSRLKALVHRYEETRDLRLIGGYRQGADADLDIAVRQVPIIYEILKQTPGERPSADAFTDLATALKNGAVAITPAKRG
ncbi:flagellar protein export ATPase FliI [Agrobacterium sp. SHOUNA12C]|uniref:Flagellum-specific ATP synthase n=2 Tax=Rhizobium rhizogenes TaxID=359 RepID=B9J962_RHIR8|nr:MULTISPECIES: flagellar protein export ATPase FliI [Rhizobium]ACM25464.1 H(+)-transporting ATP synthase [Rhizobium rhizogenes K84]KAA6486803.1 flagellar protein export ATPase FliI [Agrobacterium sp. ICMP 7243]MCJ9722414.1 flagellar protein export ATPase FliI [Agrobacterium sp. BETTINA12B]MCJ9757553.1 flagellar protein export ATPase FliI [Agrobacterium sp. SHOUNA12C]OCJ21808.1 flagellar protein export ATPase FliI [Agrobacterium sp. B131/95]